VEHTEELRVQLRGVLVAPVHLLLVL
jgi:hypothetical protein